jgi:hypothetical protein
MRNRFRLLMTVVAAAAVVAVVSLSVTRTTGQAQRAARIDGHPNFGGIWQALNEADWDLEAHNAFPGFVWEEGAYIRWLSCQRPPRSRWAPSVPYQARLVLSKAGRFRPPCYFSGGLPDV